MELEQLLINDLRHINHLQPEGWDDISKNIQTYCTQSFCYPIKISEANKIIGVGALILFEDSAWLAHIIVDKSHRGKGIGNRIVEHLVGKATEKGFSTINLIATELGAPIYQKVGFKPVCNYLFFKKIEPWTPKKISSSVITSKQEYYQSILNLDMEITGERRKELIYPYLSACMVYLVDQNIEGYYLPGLGQGPIYAKTERAGIALMELKYSTVDIAVLPEANETGVNFLIQNNFEIQKTTAIRMVYGIKKSWDPQHIFSRIGGNYG